MGEHDVGISPCFPFQINSNKTVCLIGLVLISVFREVLVENVQLLWSGSPGSSNAIGKSSHRPIASISSSTESLIEQDDETSQSSIKSDDPLTPSGSDGTGSTHFYQQLRLGLLSTICVWLFGAFVFSVTESWTFFDALFFTFQCFTTIGYGDLIPRSSAGIIFFCFYTFIGIGVFNVQLL
jgi:hypothetical protein